MKRTCSGCEEDVAAHLCSPWGKNWMEKACISNYKRQMGRCKASIKLKAWWAGLSSEEKVAWYKRNKGNYVPGGKRAFDNSGFIEESHQESASNIDDTVWAYVPYDEYFIRERLLGNAGSGTLDEQRAIVRLKFDEILQDKKQRSMKVAGVNCVGIFKGFEERAREETKRSFATKRQQVVNDAADHRAALELGEQAKQRRIEYIADVKARANEGVVPSASDVDDSFAAEAKNPVVVKADGNSDFADDIGKQVLLGMQRDAKTIAQEDVDQHEAEQAHKIQNSDKKSGAGRPRKGMTEVLSDISKIKRDRLTQITDGIDTLQRGEADVLKEAKRQLGEELDTDLKTLAEAMKAEIITVAAKMQEVFTKVNALKLEGAGAEDGASSLLVEVKKVIMDTSKPAFTEHMALGTKVINSFRGALKKAVKPCGGKKKKGAAADGPAIPPTVQRIVEITKKSVPDSCNVKLHHVMVRFEKSTQRASMCMVANCKGDLEKVKAIGVHQKWILNHISKSESLTYAIAAYKPALSRQVQAILSSKAGPLISTDVVLPSEYDMIKDEIFTAQHWAMNEAHVSASLTPYGLPEVRLLFSGAYIICGVRFEHILPPAAGGKADTIKAKIEHLMTEKGFQQFLEDMQVPDKGFWLIHDAEFSFVNIPPGHVLFTIGMHGNTKEAQGAHGIRWSTLDTKNPEEVKFAQTNVNSILSTYPELQTEDYKVWADCLTKFLVPTIPSG